MIFYIIIKTILIDIGKIFHWWFIKVKIKIDNLWFSIFKIPKFKIEKDMDINCLYLIVLLYLILKTLTNLLLNILFRQLYNKTLKNFSF